MINFDRLKWLKFGITLFGALLCVAGLWYLAEFISHINLTQHLAALGRLQFFVISILILCLTLSYILIAISWRYILSDYGCEISTRRAQLIFSFSNIGKYVPGNVLHIAGRQVLTMREGVPGWVVAKSLVIETILLALTSAVFAVAFWLFSRSSGAKEAVFAMLFFSILVVVGVLASRRFGLVGSARAVLGYSAYHLIGGLAFTLLFITLSDYNIFNASLVFFLVAAYVAGWVIGQLTPGAPAGLGVREAVLIGLLTSVVPDVAVLGTAVLLSRGMSILSDLLYFLVLHGLNLRSIRTSF